MPFLPVLSSRGALRVPVTPGSAGASEVSSLRPAAPASVRATRSGRSRGWGPAAGRPAWRTRSWGPTRGHRAAASPGPPSPVQGERRGPSASRRVQGCNFQSSRSIGRVCLCVQGRSCDVCHSRRNSSGRFQGTAGVFLTSSGLSFHFCAFPLLTE